MKEAAMRHKVVQALKPLDAMSVENACRAGTPDVNFTDGWIELKQIGRLPVHSDTPVRVPHFNPSQRVWLRRRWHKGGKAFVLLLIGNETWLLFQGCWAGRFLGDVPYATLEAHALRVWHTGLDGEELLECVTNCSPLRTGCCCTASISAWPKAKQQ